MRPSRWTLRFPSSEDEREFASFDPDGDLRPQRLLAGVLAAFLIVNPVWRYFISGHPLDGYMLMKVGIGVGIGVFNALGMLPFLVVHRRAATAICVAALIAALATTIALAPPEVARGLYSIGLLMMFANGLLAHRWPEKFVMNLVICAMSIVWCLRSGLFLGREGEVIVNIQGLSFGLACAVAYTGELGRRGRFLAEREATRASARSDAILCNALPERVAHRLKNAGEGERVIDEVPDAVVLFADIVGFTAFSAARSADQVVRTLDLLFERFDVICATHGLEKIKTIGDAYMAAAGLPSPDSGAAASVADAALAMLDAVVRLKALGAFSLDLRIGVHRGPVVAGVIGRTRFLYDLWGDTVNVAARLEATALPGRVQISSEMAGVLRSTFELERRGVIALKGRGEVETFFLRGRSRPAQFVEECAASL